VRFIGRRGGAEAVQRGGGARWCGGRPLKLGGALGAAAPEGKGARRHECATRHSMPWSVEGGDELGRPGRRRCVVGHGGERSGWRLKEVPTCGSRLAAAEREGKKVGR
jgi:hypothetical protein